jgi:hypothetical protein
MPDNVGNSLNTATSIVLGSNTKRFSDSVEQGDNDYYRFTLSSRSSFNLALSGLTANAEVELLNSTGSVVAVNGIPQSSTNAGALVESINTILEVGTYYIRVFPSAPTDPNNPATTPSTNYNLDVAADNGVRTDIVWRRYDNSQGRNTIWRMNGTTSLASTDVAPSVADSRWRIVGTGDFNNDGIDDIYWRWYGSSGNVAGRNTVWTLNANGGQIASTELSPVTNLNWEIRAIADFNRDGVPDQVWRNRSESRTDIWLLNRNGALVQSVRLPNLGSDWDVQAAGDFNGDGNQDLIFRNTANGINSIWLMNGTSSVTSVALTSEPNLSKQIAGSGDFNGDGFTDILWRNNSTGANEVWLMERTGRTAIAPINSVSDTLWRAVAPYRRSAQINLFDVAGSTQPLDIGPLTGNATYRDEVGRGSDQIDAYRFSLGSRTTLDAVLEGQSTTAGSPFQTNLDLVILDAQGVPVQSGSSTNSGNSPESISGLTLNPGTYTIQVLKGAGAGANESSTYNLRLNVNNLPTLVSGGPLTVSEGGSQTISNSLLLITDENNPPSQVTYTLVNPPNTVNGSLLSNGEALVQSSVFTQADINQGRISYRQNGGEVTSDTFVFAASDGQGGTVVQTTFTINVIPVNDPPELLSLGELSATEGATTTISSTTLLVTDVEQTPTQLSYSLTSLPTGGNLFVGARQLSLGNTFTQADVNSNRLTYRQSGGEEPTDSFSFTVSDGAGGSLTPASRTLSIAVENVNDPPQLVTNTALTLSQGASSDIFNTLLRATDAEFTSPAQQDRIIYSVAELPTRGTLIYKNAVQTASFTFTQADLNDPVASLSYLHDGSPTNSDRFTFNISDGTDTTRDFTYEIFVRRTPSAPNTLNNAPLSVSEGTIAVIGSSVLQVTDADSNPGAITFSLGSLPTKGLLTRNGTALSQGQSFTQADINNGLLRYVHNGSEPEASPTDSFIFNFTDERGAGPVAASSFSINLVPVNDAPVVQVRQPRLTLSEGQIVDLPSTLLRATDNDNEASELLYIATPPSAGSILVAGTVSNIFTQADVDANIVKYIQNGDQTTSDRFVFVVADPDGASDGPITLNIGITPINDAPTLSSISGPITLDEDTANAPISLTVGDRDAGESPLRVTIQASNGFVTVNDSASLQFTNGTSNGSSSLNFTGTLANLQTALGSLVYQGNPDYFGNDLVTITVNDQGATGQPGPQSVTRTLTFNVLPVNDAPSFSGGDDVTTLEDFRLNETSPTGVTVISGWASNIVPGPANEVAQGLTFDFSSSDTTLFNDLFVAEPTVDRTTGDLTIRTKPNANGTITLTATLQDTGGTANGGVDISGPFVFTVVVNQVNDRPSFQSSQTRTTVNEDSGTTTINNWATNIIVGPSTPAANEDTQTPEFIITTSNPELFSTLPQVNITGDTGALVFTPAEDANGVAILTINLRDSGGTANGGIDTSSPPAFYTVTVRAVNDAPTFTSTATTITSREDDDLQTIAFANDISTGAANETQTLSFRVNPTVSGFDVNRFFEVAPRIDSTTGALTYKTRADVNGSVELTATLVDSGDTSNGGRNTSDPYTFTINATPVNDAPSFTRGADQTIAEDSAPVTRVGWATGIRPGPSTSFANESTQSTNFLVSTDNPDLFASGGSPAISSNGNLTYSVAANANGRATVTVQLQDDGGTGDGGIDTSAPQTFVINVTAVNDLPTLTLPTAQQLSEDTTLSFSTANGNAISATDIDSGELPIIVTLAVLNGVVSLPSVAGITSVTGNSTATVTLTGTASSIATALEQVTYAPTANFFGNDTLTVTVNDQGNTGSGIIRPVSGTVAITVNPVPDAPELLAVNRLTVGERGSGVITNTLLRATDVDTSLGQVLYEITASPTAGVVRRGATTLGDGDTFSQLEVNNRSITYLQTLSNAPSDAFSFQLTDGTTTIPDASSPDFTFDIAIIQIDDPPTLVVNQGLALNEGTLADIPNTLLSYTDTDTPPENLVYTLTSAPDSGGLQLAGSELSIGDTFTQADVDAGSLSYQQDGSESLGDSFTFRIGDGTTSLSSVFEIEVLPVNDAPELLARGPLTVAEGGSTVLRNTVLNASDPDTSAAQVIYTLDSAPRFGNLQRGTTTLTNNSTFSQDELNRGTVRYVHNGGETTSDAFFFSVTDGSSPAIRDIMNIVVNPVNDAPQLLSNNPLSINASQPSTRTISSSLLRATDVDNTDPAEVRYVLASVPNPTVGQLTLSGTALAIGGTFSQDDINRGRVQYRYLGGGTSDGFRFALKDAGGADGGTAFFVISFTA